MTTRLSAILNDSSDYDIDGILITSQANVFYVSQYNSDPHERLMAVYADHKHDPVLIVPSMEENDARQAGWSHAMIAYQDHENPWDKLRDYLTSRHGLPKRIGLEYDHLTIQRYNELVRIMPDTRTEDVQAIIAQMRNIKNNEEYKQLKEAAKLADYGVKLGTQALKEGISELEVIAAIEYGLKQQGVTAMSFSTMVLFGEKAASPHGTPGTRTLKKGDMVLFDLGVIYNGYCSDISRTVAFRSYNNQQQHIYETVLAAQKQAIERSTTGAAVGEVDQAARDCIESAGYGDYFPHRIGHGLGIETHEAPSMHGDNTAKLTSGMCYTIEPGIYVPDTAGVRIEDMIIMTDNGAQVLTEFPKELQVIS